MSSRSDQYAAETRSDQYDPYEDGADDVAGESTSSYFPTWAWGWWPSLGPRDVEDNPATPETEYHPAEEAGEDGGFGSLWDESLITLLIVGGAILFVIPEPATSGLGILLVSIGVIAWLVDWAL